MSWFDGIGDVAKQVGMGAVSGWSVIPGVANWVDKEVTSPDAALEAERKRKLQEQAAASGRFAGQSTKGYQALGARGTGALDALQATAQGQNSVSAEQLRQGLLQQQGQLQSMAASARPGNSAMAARQAMIQSGRLGAGLAGQQAIAGLQERQQAQQAYGGLLQGLRGQDLQGVLGGRQGALQGYSAANAGVPAQSDLQKYGPLIQSGLQAGAALSDRRLKTDIEDGSEAADGALKGLKAHFFRYKDSRHGEGSRVGVMAQDLERAGLGHAVFETPSGKAVHGGHLATALAAMMPGIDKRLSRLEGSK